MNKIAFSIFAFLLPLISLYAQTSGKLTVSVTTAATGGNYAPRNIVAIWIENADGDFVKTLLAYGNKRKTHLNKWQSSTTTAGSEFNSVDAVSGATQSSHSTRSCTWDGTNFTGSAVPDGNYFVRMELTDKNATGNYSSFSFAKGLAPQVLTPNNEPSFSSVKINWTPISKDATLSALYVDGVGVLVPPFNANIFDYAVVLPNSTSSATVGATASDANATVTGTGAVDLSSGAGVATIDVTAQDNAIKKTYTINISVLATELQLKDEDKININYNRDRDVVAIANSNNIEMVEIFSLSGKLLTKEMVYGISLVEINTEQLPKGTYILRIKQSSGEMLSDKFIK